MAELYGPPNPFAAVRAKAKKKAAAPKVEAPVPAPVAPIGQIQPMISMEDPFDAALAIPSGMQSMPKPYMGPGSFDKRGDKMQQSAQRAASRTQYKTPGEYYSQLGTVMGSPLMQKLSSGIENMQGLREMFLKNAPNQVDYSPLMALADYIAGPGGTAMKGYKRPGSFDDKVAQLAGLLQNEQGAAYNQANLAMGQVPLKAGEESAQTGAQVGSEMDTGFQVPKPSTGLTMLSPSAMLGAEKWYTDKTQKNLQEFAGFRDQLDALQVALDSGSIGAVKRALGVAARALSGEKGVVTDKDIGRVLPQTIGMTFAEFASYITNDPSVKLDPFILADIKKEVGLAKDRLYKRYELNQKNFDETIRGSKVMGDIPDRMGGAARKSFEQQKPAEGPKEKDIGDKLLERLNKISGGTK